MLINNSCDTTAADKESVEKTLASVGRKLYCIIGDGNCFFRALSYIIYGMEDNHCVVRSTLVHFSELNAEQYCTSGTVQDSYQTYET